MPCTTDVLIYWIPEGVTTVGYADDVVLVVVAKHITTVERKCSESIQSVQKWLRNNGLELAIQKTEADLLTTRKKLETIRESAPHLRYLVVVIDARMTLQEHLNRASERAMKAIFALSRIMSNIGGPRYTKRKLLASVLSSIMGPQYGVRPPIYPGT